MEIIDVQEVIEDGIIYVITTYSNGVVIKQAKEGMEPLPDNPQMSDIEEAILETALNTEYLVCLAELGL